MKELKTIGVLLPQSKAFPKIGKEFLKGLKMSLKDLEVDLKIEGIGLGNDSGKVIDSIQKLVNQEDVDITTGLLGHNGIDDIHDFVEGIEEPLIYSDLGAVFPADLSKRKNIYCNSLDLYKSTNLLGKYFSENGIEKVGTSTSYYDAGYGFIDALGRGINQNDKSEVSGHFITPLHPRENEAELMEEYMQETSPDAIFAFHNGVFAKEHASYLKRNRINDSIPLYASSFSVEDRVLNEFPELFDGTFIVSPWTQELNNLENVDFVNGYRSEYDTAPSIFSVLGYENGLLIKDYLTHDGFSKGKLKGPRGVLTMDDSKRSVYTDYLWRLSFVNNEYNVEKIESLGKEVTYEIISSNTESSSNGWHNAYLCH